MTIRGIVGQGLHYARTCTSLWLFGFVVGMASGGSGGGNGGVGIRNGGRAGGDAAGAWDIPFGLSATEIVLIVAAIVLAIAVLFVMRFISEGALIEGVVRARQGGRMTTREGFRAGWAHWGVLVRIALLYFGATIGSLALVAVPCVAASRALGMVGAIAVGIPALLVAVPWLITLYLIQAFASRIAVLENRRALDAIAKARLFLHGRLMLGLKLVVATFIGTLVMLFLGLAAMAPVALALTFVIRLFPVIPHVPVIVLGCLVLLPALYVLTAMVGTFRSSIWTLGYVTEVES